jgi:hypothetical protein
LALSLWINNMNSTISFTNSADDHAVVEEARISRRWPWLMLVFRAGLFVFFQLVFFLLLAGQGTGDAWAGAAAWWPFSATLAGLVMLFVLAWLMRREGSSYRAMLQFNRKTFGKDLLLMLVLLVVSAPLAMIPNFAVGTALFGSMEPPLNLFVRPLPMWASAIAMVAFPILVALTELPAYFGYAMPRLAVLTRRRWLAWVLASFALAAQHMALPLLFDPRFLLWRLLMFVPFAFAVGALLMWRPRLLPFLMVGHALIDLMTISMVWTVSTGGSIF